MIKLVQDDTKGWWIAVGEKNHWPFNQRVAVTAEEIMQLAHEEVVKNLKQLEKDSNYFKKKGINISVG